MRMILIAVVALLVLGGGGAGAYFFYFKKAEAAVGAEGEIAAATEEHGKDAKKTAEKGKGGGHGGGSETMYVELDPLILPIIDNNGVSQVVSIVVALEVEGINNSDEVKKMTPKLKDAYIQDMYGVLNKYAALKGGVIQVNTLKGRLNKITTEVMGKDIVHDVLLQVVQQRPI